VALNLKAPEALDICLRLAEQCDVVMENFRPGVADRLGLGYDAIRARRPDVVYLSISAYGQDGPWAAEPGYDLIMQGVGGLMSVTGEPGGRPLKAGVAETDILAGTNAAVAVVSALLARERARNAGEAPGSQYVDVGLFDGQISLMGYHLVCCLLSGKVPQPVGNSLPYIVPYQAFRTADIEVLVSGNNDRQFRGICAALGVPELATDPRFLTNGDRVRNREALIPQLEAIFLTRPGDKWIEILSKHGIVAGPINTVDRVAAHPQVAYRKLLVEVDHPVGRVPTPTMPWKFGTPSDRDEAPLPPAPPLLGQHTEAVLTRLLDFTPAQVDDLEARGVCRRHNGRIPT
jgi:crotonobetainyl-CoA:carnitine CoA-transferase CaiB-like acyl-CoA transferase